MRCSFGLFVLGLVLVQVSISERLVKRQDQLGTTEKDVSSSCSTSTGTNGTCVPRSSCSVNTSAARNDCPLQSDSNETGICCPNSATTTSADQSAPVSAKPASITPSIVKEEDPEKDREKIEKLLLERGLFVQAGTAEALHNAIVFADVTSQALGKEAVLQESNQDSVVLVAAASPALFPPNTTTTTRRPGTGSAAGPPLQIRKPCIEPQLSCLKTGKYRSYDGSCNNLHHTEWGMSHKAFTRLIPPSYADGISKPRVTSYDGTALPSTRLVSTTILKHTEVEFSNISLFFMAFGQFVDHDLTLTPTTRGANGTGILCCPPLITEELRHPDCMTIDIPADDPFYKQFNKTCMEFVRTIPAPLKRCARPNEPREQINQLTNYIDGSMIYGSDDKQAEKLRSKSGGKLLAGAGSPPRELPPHFTGPGCSGDGKRHYCFIAGDVRSAEQPLLATIHIAFFREHNRIADELAKLNPDWDDEILYQETRRIMGAILQHVIYNEYLPVVLGDSIMQQYNLSLHQIGFWDTYDPKTDASILNEFAAAAFRFAHSAVPSLIKVVDENDRETTQQMRDHFLQPYDASLFNDYARGLLVQSSNRIDDGFTPDITNHLFQRNGRFGLDLPAMNMQRGRDHAIGTYTQARKICGLEEVKSFQNLSKFMDSNIASEFSKLYENVEDIDLWIGGVVEKPLPGAAIGPTFACIIAEQFKRVKIGDRFWHERGKTESSFSEDQLLQIRQSSLARILCNNSDISMVQPLVMLKPSPSNSPVQCGGSDEIPHMSLFPWTNGTVGLIGR